MGLKASGCEERHNDHRLYPNRNQTGKHRATNNNHGSPLSTYRAWVFDVYF